MRHPVTGSAQGLCLPIHLRVDMRRVQQLSDILPINIASLKSRSNYRFHPVRGQVLAVIKQHHVHDEACYVVRRADGTPLSAPALRTHCAAVHMVIVPAAQPPVSALFELRSFMTTCLPSLVRDARKKDHDSAATSDTAKTTVRKRTGGACCATIPTGTRAAQEDSGAVAASAGKRTRRGARR
jgi:hypothetical protein